MRRAAGFALVLGIALSSSLSYALESETYLGNKLRYVIQRVDNTYVEKNKDQLVAKHRRALEDLGKFLGKQYPSLGHDLQSWLDKNYGESLRRIRSARNSDRREGFSFDALLILDREDPLFRRRLVAQLADQYPALFDDMAAFLRDNYPSALREVLRMTLRMTSHVTPCARVAAKESAGKAGASGKAIAQGK